MRKLLVRVSALTAARARRSRRPRRARAVGAGRDPRLREGSTSTSSRTGTLTHRRPTTRPSRRGSAAPRDEAVEDLDPYSGKGYESAVAYAVAQQLGFTKAQVKWTVVPFNNSFRPGKKPFDFYIDAGLVHARAREGRRLLELVLLRQPGGRRRARARRSRRRSRSPGCKPYKLGAQVGTTSYDYIAKYIKPSQKPARLRHERRRGAGAEERARSTGSSSTSRPRSTSPPSRSTTASIVGKLPTQGTQEHFGIVFQKGNPLARCVNKALDRLWANGTIKKLQTT